MRILKSQFSAILSNFQRDKTNSKLGSEICIFFENGDWKARDTQKTFFHFSI